MSNIQLVQQPTSNSCVSACISMVSGIPVQQVYDEFHHAYHKHEVRACDYLEANGITVEPYRTDEQSITEPGVYLLAVPSLNIVGGLHEIVLDSRDEYVRLYDPAMPGRKRYVMYEDPACCGEYEVQLTSWCVDYRIVKSEHLEIW